MKIIGQTRKVTASIQNTALRLQAKLMWFDEIFKKYSEKVNISIIKRIESRFFVNT